MAFTYFFRDKYTLDLIKKHVFPELKNQKYMSIWDAGCAMGPEPYSIAIILRENMGNFLFRNLTIYATDIDGSDLFADIIRKGIYHTEQLKSVPKDILDKYFSPDEKKSEFRINDEIRKCIKFQKHNLLSLNPIREGLSLIVCKNVLLHFKEEERINVIKMFHKALMNDGYFCTEQTQKLPASIRHLFEPVAHSGQLFRKVG